MTENSVETKLEVYEEEMAEFELGCEMPTHETEPLIHKGKAEWYMVVKCVKCDFADTKLTCDRFKQAMVMMQDMMEGVCNSCGNTQTLGETVSFTKK